MSARVLDLTTSLGGAYAARLLSAAGVAVTRVEPPSGHWLRRWSASGSTMADGGDGALFRWLAGGQSSLVAERGDPLILEEVAWADAVLWSPGALIELDDVVAGSDVVVALTPFGTTGPWADRPSTELTLQAMSGGPILRGSRPWPPVTAGGEHGEYMAGVFAAVAALLALRQRALGGPGGLVDVSALESVIMTQLFNPITMETMIAGVRPRRYKATVADVVPTKDGYVGFAVVNRLQHWLDFCSMIGRADWADDPTLHAVINRTERSDELNPVIWAWAAERTTAEIVELAALWRVPAIEVGNGASIPAMDHFAEYGFYAEHPGGGFLQPTAPFRMHPPIPGVGELRRAPALGETAQALPPRSLPAGDGSGGLPLAGVRVADFTSFWAGPFLAHTMAMFGADVIHVESTTRPDGARLMNWHPPTEPRWWEWSSYFQATNTNKRGVTVDLATAEGQDLARRLVAACDVVVENYSPRVMDGFGLSWDDVRAVRPDALMVRMPAFGLGGPWRDRTGFAMTMEQVSGMAWISGPPEHPPGALFGPCDPSAGLHALVGLLAALEHRRHTGEGRLIEVPMVGGALNVCAEQVIEHSAHGVLLHRDANRGPAAAPQGCYAAADLDPDLGQHRWVAIAVADDRQWAALRGVLGDLSGFDTAAERHAAHDPIDAHISTWCSTRGADDIVDILVGAGVPAVAVVHPSAQLDFAQLHGRRFFEQVEHPVCAASTHVTFPFRLPGQDGPMHRRPAPTLGEHDDEIFGGLLGLTAGELAALRTAGVIGTELR
jgi:crotonobetainyl-CoA:carnitine CoA-transferase CaiB-like acyl-CoA transferase